MQITVDFDQNWLEALFRRNINRLKHVQKITSFELKVERVCRYGPLHPEATAQFTDEHGRPTSLEVSSSVGSQWLRAGVIAEGYEEERITFAQLICIPEDDGLRICPNLPFFLKVVCQDNQAERPASPREEERTWSPIATVKLDQEWLEKVLRQNIEKLVQSIDSLKISAWRFVGPYYPNVEAQCKDKNGRAITLEIDDTTCSRWLTEAVSAEGYQQVRSAHLFPEDKVERTRDYPEGPFFYEVEYRTLEKTP